MAKANKLLTLTILPSVRNCHIGIGRMCISLNKKAQNVRPGALHVTPANVLGFVCFVYGCVWIRGSCVMKPSAIFFVQKLCL